MNKTGEGHSLELRSSDIGQHTFSFSSPPPSSMASSILFIRKYPLAVGGRGLKCAREDTSSLGMLKPG